MCKSLIEDQGQLAVLGVFGMQKERRGSFCPCDSLNHGLMLQASEGPAAAQAYLAIPGPGVATARSILSETYLRRLSKLPLDDLEDQKFD